jgi:hypothetical protein
MLVPGFLISVIISGIPIAIYQIATVEDLILGAGIAIVSV